MSALSAMQDKTQHLENSLSAETRVKLDLFSALGDAKRQLEIAQGRKARAHVGWQGLEVTGMHRMDLPPLRALNQRAPQRFPVWCLSSIEIRSQIS